MDLNKENSGSANAKPVKKDRKEIVKTLIIVFLLIMLLLTFFSNTIMNRSLAEVSVSRLSRETLKRSNPIELLIEANKNYTLTADEAREIKRVAVKRGQEVKEGQVLFYLKEVSESEAAKALQDEIDAAKLDYEKSLLKRSPDYYDMKAAVQSARDDLNDAIRERDNASSAPSVPSAPDNSEEISRLNEQKKVLTSDKNCIENKNFALLSSDRGSGISELYSVYMTAQSEYDDAAVKAEGRGSDIIGMNRTLDTLNTELSRLEEDKAESRVIEDKKKEIENLKEDILLVEDMKTKSASRDTAEKNYKSAEAILSASVDNDLEEVKSQLETLMSESGTGSIPSIPDSSPVDYDAAVRAKQYAYDAAVHNLEEKIASDKLLDDSENLDLAAARKKIEEKEKKLEEMVSKQSETEIKSPVDGVVEEIKLTAGNSFEVNDELMVINISGEGFTANYKADSEKIKRISKGQTFSLFESRDDVSVVLSDMKKDKNDTKSTVLTFTLTGDDVVAGKTVKIDIGDEPVQMENVVPKTAVKEDSKGKFVYVVKSKSSPLGNRYIVQRIDVNVTASDDTKAALSGEFGDSADYIITASSKPFNPGDQVRLSED